MTMLTKLFYWEKGSRNIKEIYELRVTPIKVTFVPLYTTHCPTCGAKWPMGGAKFRWGGKK